MEKSSPTTRNAGIVREDDHIEYTYLAGFGNSFESECMPGALIKGRNNPREVPFGLYTEQLSGTAFTAPRSENKRTWLYRIQPSVAGRGPARATSKCLGEARPSDCKAVVEPLRWKPFPTMKPTSGNINFLQGLQLQCSSGGGSDSRVNIFMYAMNQSMSSTSSFFVNRDGDMLIMPQDGSLLVQTELGNLKVEPCELVLIPRGIVFQVDVASAEASSDRTTPLRGYVLEVAGGPGFRLPELGPIGSNGLANARDFLHPVADCVRDRETYAQACKLTIQTDSCLFEQDCDHSCFNVVAWHGNYLPYKYDLRKFCAVNSVSYDHLDPSIYTVLTCPSSGPPGTALVDVVVFPPRLLATDSQTLRPPWFHSNVMSEYMGNLYGRYDAKKDFMPGGSSLHTCLVPHGPDGPSYQAAVADPCTSPVHLNSGMSFMFETCRTLKVAPNAMSHILGWRDMDYTKCWLSLTADNFTGWDRLQDKNQSERDTGSTGEAS